MATTSAQTSVGPVLGSVQVLRPQMQCVKPLLGGLGQQVATQHFDQRTMPYACGAFVVQSLRAVL